MKLSHSIHKAKKYGPRNIADEHVVGISLVDILSFTAMVISRSGPSRRSSWGGDV